MSDKPIRATLLAEMETYRFNLYWLVPRHAGRWVVIRGTEIGVYSSREDAEAAGRAKYGSEPWLIRRVTRYESEE